MASAIEASDSWRVSAAAPDLFPIRPLVYKNSPLYRCLQEGISRPRWYGELKTYGNTCVRHSLTRGKAFCERGTEYAQVSGVDALG